MSKDTVEDFDAWYCREFPGMDGLMCNGNTSAIEHHRAAARTWRSLKDAFHAEKIDLIKFQRRAENNLNMRLSEPEKILAAFEKSRNQ